MTIKDIMVYEKKLVKKYFFNDTNIKKLYDELFEGVTLKNQID